MSRLKQYNPGGVLLPGDLNRLEDDYETAFSSYRTLFTGDAQNLFIRNANTSNIYMVNSGAIPPFDVGQDEFWFDPADFASAGRTARLRLKLMLICNNIAAPAITFVARMYPIATFAGTSGNNPTIATLGTSIAAAEVNIINPAAGSAPVVNGSDFTAPSANWYVLAVATSGTPTANSGTYCRIMLQMRQT